MPADTYEYKAMPVTDRTPLVAALDVRGTSQWGLAPRGAAPAPVRARESVGRAAAREQLTIARAPQPFAFTGCPVVPDLLNRQFPAATLTSTHTVGGVEYNALTSASDLVRLQAEADAAAAAAAASGAVTAMTPADALAEARAALVAVPARLLAGAGLRAATEGLLRGLGLLLVVVAGAGLLADLAL
jgi:hypothetical protein